MHLYESNLAFWSCLTSALVQIYILPGAFKRKGKQGTNKKK